MSSDGKGIINFKKGIDDLAKNYWSLFWDSTKDKEEQMALTDPCTGNGEVDHSKEEIYSTAQNSPPPPSKGSFDQLAKKLASGLFDSTVESTGTQPTVTQQEPAPETDPYCPMFCGEPFDQISGDEYRLNPSSMPWMELSITKHSRGWKGPNYWEAVVEIGSRCVYWTSFSSSFGREMLSTPEMATKELTQWSISFLSQLLEKIACQT